MADANYKHDVFISYRWVWPDCPWVRKRLVPALERAGLKVWLEVSKSAPACDLYEETETAINDSRKALCVISPAYLREIEKNARMVAVEFRNISAVEPVGQGPCCATASARQKDSYWHSPPEGPRLAQVSRCFAGMGKTSGRAGSKRSKDCSTQHAGAMP